MCVFIPISTIAPPVQGMPWYACWWKCNGRTLRKNKDATYLGAVMSIICLQPAGDGWIRQSDRQKRNIRLTYKADLPSDECLTNPKWDPHTRRKKCALFLLYDSARGRKMTKCNKLIALGARPQNSGNASILAMRRRSGARRHAHDTVRVALTCA